MYCANGSSSEWLPAKQFDHAPRQQAFAMERLGWLVLLSIILSTVSGGCDQFVRSVPTVNLPVCCARTRQRRGRKSSSGGVGSYSRYSSGSQREESIEQQRRRCREQAQDDGFEIDPQLEFADQAVSGTKRQRAGLNAMLAAAEAGEISVLYLHSLSRLARESVITMPLMKRLVFKFDVRVISIADGLDTDRDDWPIIATIMSLMHERYIDELRENVRRGQEEALLSGYSVGDYCFGFSSEPVPGSEVNRRGRNGKPRMQYVIDSDHASWVLRIFHWFVEDGRSLRWIAKELTRLNAPKDHRSTTPGWHHELVTGVLTNRKYVGIWPWSENCNVRDPETGTVHQEPRPEEECERWTRQLPHLRIIDDDTFEAAQKRLRENADRYAPRRTAEGRLRGASAGGNGQPRHLLEGLIVCGECGEKFQVASQTHLACRGYLKFGRCSCGTWLNRKRAEKMILDALGERILTDNTWTEATLEAQLRAWRRRQQERPSELRTRRDGLQAVQGVIKRLVDAVEKGLDDPEISRRLRERREEERKLLAAVEKAERSESHAIPEPTRDLLQDQLRNLGQTLQEPKPAAATALRELVGGTIIVEEIHQDGQRHLRGTITLRAAALQKAVGAVSSEPTQHEEAAEEHVEQIVIDFVEPPLIVEQSEQAKRLRDQGLSNVEIGRQLGVGKSRVTAVLRYWYESRDLPVPDGRSSRVSSATPLYRQIAPQTLEMYQADRLIAEIADELGVDLETVRKSLRYLADEGQIQLEDGRKRRRRLRQKSRSKKAG